MTQKINFKYHVSVFLAILIAGSSLFAQSNLPDKPILEYVTTDTSTNAVKVCWKASTSENIRKYCIYTLDITTSPVTGTFLDSVDSDVFMYSHNKEKLEADIYTVTAIDMNGNESLLGGDFHKPVKVDIAYDSCSSSMLLSWDKYYGWKHNLTGYKIFMKSTEENSDIKKNQDANGFVEVYNMIDTSMLEFTVDDISENILYDFYIEAYDNGGRSSLSNARTKFTYMPPPPAFLNLDYVTVIDQRTVELAFSTDPSGPVNDFLVSRGSAIGASFTPIKSISNLEESTYVFTDNIKTQGERFFYKVEAVNSCQVPILVSNTGNNILLEKDRERTDGSIITIQWKEYESFGSGDHDYRIFRKNAFNEHELVTTLSSDETSFSENIAGVSGTKIEGSVSYMVEAIENGSNPLGLSGISKSNELVIDVETSMFMPNAFSPNGDTKNDIFKPVFDFLPEDYKMFIYDRSGKILFQSADPQLGWDGTVNGRQQAIEGIYVYHIEYLSFNGVRKAKTGNVTLIYP